VEVKRVAILVLAAACARAPRHEPHFLPTFESEIALPPGFRPAAAPPENPVTLKKAELGRHLFYDVRLSANQKQSCASCHRQELAFTDGHVHAIGATGEEHYRNTMTLTNVGYRTPLTWADPAMHSLEEQLYVPLTNKDPVELGMDGRFDELVSRIQSDETYRALFADAFPDQAISMKTIACALASFERTLISGNSPYDRFVAWGENDALSPAARRGMRIFFSEAAGCSTCHAGQNFDSAAFTRNGTYVRTRDRGLEMKSGHRADEGKYRVPTLRNVAVTAPYMHDGRLASLGDVIDHYQKFRHFTLNDEEKRDLIAFLESLTDRTFLTDARLGDPWRSH
jgi:cytochrome c peroxidase